MINTNRIIVGTMRLGSWGAKLSTHQLEEFIEYCTHLGLNEFDLADIYGHYTSEEAFGQVLKRRPDLKAKVKITTKFGIKLISENRPSHKIKSYDTSKQHIITSVENSLTYLGIEQIENLLIHRPDWLLDHEEVQETILNLKKQGKVRHFGVSNFTGPQIERMSDYLDMSTNQIEFSLSNHSAMLDATIDICLKNNISITAWSPLGGGSLLKEKLDNLKLETVLNKLSEKYKATRDQILLAWVFRHPAKISAVIGTTKTERIHKALEATKIHLAREEWYELLEAANNQEVA